MKVAGSVIIILALVLAVLPQFTDCQSQGRSLQVVGGKTVPMKCHWTAIAELALSIPLFLIGGMLFFRKQKETQSSLSILGVSLGILAVLVPTTLIGVCANPDMLCNMILKPALILSGVLVTAISLGILVFSRRGLQPAL